MATNNPSIPPCPLCGAQRVEGRCTKEMGVTKLEGGIVQRMKALICTYCGYVTFHVPDPQQFIPSQSGR